MAVSSFELLWIIRRTTATKTTSRSKPSPSRFSPIRWTASREPALASSQAAIRPAVEVPWGQAVGPPPVPTKTTVTWAASTGGIRSLGRTTRRALTTGSSAVSSRPPRTVDLALRSTVNSPTCTKFTRAATPSTRTISSQRSSMFVRGVRPTTVTPSPSRCGAHPANTTTPCSRSTGT